MMPRWLRRLERLLLAADDREYLGGDLEERYWEDRRRFGPCRAGTSYAAALLCAIPAQLFGEAGRATRDLRLAIRTLRRRPGFAAAAILTLALGIGATTAMWSIASAVLLAPLPYPSPDRLLFVSSAFPGATSSGDQLSYIDIREIADRARTIEAIAPFTTDKALEFREGQGDAERVRANIVDPEYLGMLGAKAARGRLLGEQDNLVPNGHPVVVLTHEFWQQRLGGDPAVIGRVLRLSDVPLTVVGVLTPRFRDVSPEEGFGFESDVFIPVMMAPAFAGPTHLTDRAIHNFWAVARLRDGVSPQQALAEIAAIGRDLERQHRENRGFTFWAEPLEAPLERHDRGPIVLLLAGSLFLLLIGVCDVANLMLSHLSARRRELAVRRSLGASRWQLLRLVSADALVLSLAGGALGLLVALGGADAFQALVPADLTSRLGPVRIDRTVLGCAAFLTISTALALAAVAALREPHPGGALADGARGSTDAAGHSFRRTVLVVQVACALVLTAAASLMLGSLARLRHSDLGFRTERLLTFSLDLTAARYAGQPALAEFGSRLVTALASAPGTESAFLWGPSRPGHSNWVTFPGREDATPDTEHLMTWRHTISPGALRAIGIPLIRGREFTSAETPDSRRVVVVGDSLARRLWPGEDAIGKRLKWRTDMPASPLLEVVGVAADAANRGRIQSLLFPAYDLYVPQAQRTDRALVAVVRARSDPAAVAADIRATVRAVDPSLPMFDLTTFQTHLAKEEAETRFAAVLMSAYGVVALLLSALGLYGVLSYQVALRRREVALRMVLGASTAEVLRMVVREGMRDALLGIAVGLAVAAAGGRLLASLLFKVSAHDPRTLIGVSAVLLTVALAATLVPACRATRVAPAEALRAE